MENLLILVSGGRSSAMMARHIQTSELYSRYNKLYVFCNTGMERAETIDFLKDMVKYWDLPLNLIEGVYSQKSGVGVKSKLVDFDTLDMKGNVFKEMIKHVNKHRWVGVPNTAKPYCSEYLKTRVSHNFAKQIFGTTNYIIALGFRLEDMPKRITLAELREDKKKLAPLLTDFKNPISQKDLNVYFEKQPFELKIHGTFGNCELCWKKSDRKIIENIQAGTRFVDWHREQEQQYNDMFFRNKLSINELVKLAESGTQLSLFTDIGDGCVCSGF